MSPGPLDQLLVPLPEVARTAFLRWAETDRAPRNVADLFAQLHARMIGAGIAQGRGGYPGGRGRPGWTDYVDLQRRHLAIYHALVDAFDAPAPGLAASFRDYERAFPPTVRRMGDGYEPHVDDVAGRLIYSLPVDSGVVSVAYSFPICADDLDYCCMIHTGGRCWMWSPIPCCNAPPSAAIPR